MREGFEWFQSPGARNSTYTLAKICNRSDGSTEEVNVLSSWSSRTAISQEPRLGLCLVILGGSIAFQIAGLSAMGHPLICTCGYVELWHGNPAGPETSQHLTDWYTVTHVIHGIGFYFLLWLIAPRMSFGLRLAMAVGLEAAWEVVENAPFIMERYRQSALARGYFGDSVINSLFDTVATAFGFVLARVLPVWGSILLVTVIEFFLGYMIRDNFTLNIIQLIHPSDSISRWQTRKS
jgi:hypothetical protein